MKSTHAILLASTALFAVALAMPPAFAASSDGNFIVAQAGGPPAAAEHAADKDKQAKDKAAADKKNAAAPPAAKKVEHGQPAQAPTAQKPHEPPAAKRAEENKPAQHIDDRRPQKRDASHDRKEPKAPAAAAAPVKPAAPVAEKPSDKAVAPAAQAKPAKPAAPVAEKPSDKAVAPAAQAKPAIQPATVAQPRPSQAAPAAAATSAQPNAKPDAKPTAAAAAPPPPTKARDAGEFIRKDGQKQSRGMAEVRKERHETKDGDRTVITEGDRTIEREGKRTIIRHNEADRFAVGARDVKVDRRGDQTVSIVVRPNGISIISTTDINGHLLRRVRRDRNGRDVVIIDNGFAGARSGDFFVDLAPPRMVREHRDRYFVDAGRARPERIYEMLLAPPVERIERRYTVDQVRYNYPLREYMPRIDLDINFASGSWQLSPNQVAELSVIARGISRAIDKNPREVFMIEGHTDAVGSPEDNLSLSDRRAEAVAIALTEQFQVPPENLVTQGYGEEHLKVPSEGSERANRRVAVRRITPLIEQSQTEGSRTR